MGEVFKEGCLEPEDLGFSTFSTAWNVTWSFGICSSCKKKEAAEEFLKYLRSPGVDQKVGKKSGAPVRRGSYLEGGSDCPWFPVQQKNDGTCKASSRSVKGWGEKRSPL